MLGHTGLLADIPPELDRLVNILAWRHSRASGGDVDDCRQNAYLGLLDAARRYDPAVGCQFTTFAKYRINGAMIDADRANDQFCRRRYLSDVPIKTVELDNPELYTDAVSYVATQYDSTLRKERIALLVGYTRRYVGIREAQAVELYFGCGLLMREVGKRLGVNESRISQMLSEAIKRTRHLIKAE